MGKKFNLQYIFKYIFSQKFTKGMVNFGKPAVLKGMESL
jgi:hypothetical protein